jgi:hypothetical protein
MPLTRLPWAESVQRDSVRPGQHAWGWNWGWNPALRGFKVGGLRRRDWRRGAFQLLDLYQRIMRGAARIGGGVPYGP